MKDKVFFVSDVHLGSSTFGDTLEREKHLVRWLDFIKEEAKALYLMGDIFDFWFEYKRSVPQGFTRFLGKLAELSDSGVEIHYFIGNHDLWIFDYLPKEIGFILHKEPFITEMGGKTFYLAHGDEQSAFSFSFRLVRGIFHNRICQFFFRLIHPDFGIKLAYLWADYSRKKELKHCNEPYLGEDKEHLVIFAKSYIKTHPEIDYMIFGHRHIPLDVMITPANRMMTVGDWMQHFSYIVFDGKELVHEKFEKSK